MKQIVGHIAYTAITHTVLIGTPYNLCVHLVAGEGDYNTYSVLSSRMMTMDAREYNHTENYLKGKML